MPARLRGVAVNRQYLEIRELAAWGFDPQADRGSLVCEQLEDAARKARHSLKVRKPYEADSSISVEATGIQADALAARCESIAASGEFDGLVWQPAIVDLSKLISFQRRIRFAKDDHFEIGQMAAWQNLLDLTLPETHAQPSYALSAIPDGKSLTIRTLSPNLTVRFASGIANGLDSVQLVAHEGSPYFEVASYCGRWFLRDGYHRSFFLLKQGICHVPAVVVYAETLAELGAIGHKFFAEDILLSDHPPMVTDFLDEELVLCYHRLLQERVMRVSIQELEDPMLPSFHTDFAREVTR
jgi:hypothetical protein